MIVTIKRVAALKVLRKRWPERCSPPGRMILLKDETPREQRRDPVEPEPEPTEKARRLQAKINAAMWRRNN